MLFPLWLSNVKRWRWRYAGIALLLAMGFALFVLYGAFMGSAQDEDPLEKLELPYDALVIAEPGTRIYDPTELYNLIPWASTWPTFARYEGLIMFQEYAVATDVNSPIGAFSLLGLQSDYHYSAENLNLYGRYLKAPGEIVLPQSLVEREGLQLGDRVTLSVQDHQPWVPGVRYKSFILVGTYDAYDLQPALVSLEDALSLTADGKPNAALYTQDRDVRPQYITSDEEGFAWFMDWLRGIYPQALIIEAATSEEANVDMQSRLYRPEPSILFLIVLFTLVGCFTIAVMTYWERRREIASLKSVGISNRQLTLLICSEFGLSGMVGLILGLTILAGLASQIDWLASLGVDRLLQLSLTAGFCMIASLVLATLYPLLIMRMASVYQLLYARSIPLRTTATDHMNRPDTELVYREREQNVRILRLFADGEMKDQILILKSEGDAVKQGETIAVRESFFGYVVHEWRAFCDGHIAAIEINGIIAIRPDASDAPFYPYPASLLEFEQRRRQRFGQAAEEAPQMVLSAAEREQEAERVKERAWQRSYVTPEKSKKTGNTANAQRSSGDADKWKNARMRYLNPALGFIALALFYVGLNESMIYQHTLSLYQSTSVQRGTLQQVLSYSGYLEPLQSRELRLKVGGRLEAAMLTESEEVAQGQVLLRLSNPGLQLALSQAEQELAQAQRAYDSLLFMEEQGNAASEQELTLLELSQAYQTLLKQQEALAVYADEDGIITEVTVQPGESVKIGTPLLALAANEEQHSAERELRLRQEKLRLESGLAAAEVLEIRAAANGAVAELFVEAGQNVSAGEPLLSLSKNDDQLSGDELLQRQEASIELARLQEQVDALLITAPYEGLLTDLDLKLGEELETGQLLGVLQDQGELVLRLQVPEQEIGEIRLGDAATIRALSGGPSFSGRVQEIAAAGTKDPKNHRVSFELRVAAECKDPQRFARGAEVYIVASSGRSFGSYRATAIAARQSELTAKSAGKVTEVRAKQGERVQAGQCIAVLSNPDLELALALKRRSVEKLRLDERTAPLEAKVEEVLVQPGEQVLAGQVLLRLSNDLLQAEQSKLQREYDALALTLLGEEAQIVQSQADGQVAALHAQPGQAVKAGELLLELTNSELLIQVQIAAVQLARQEAVLQAEQRSPDSGAIAQTALRLSQAENKLAQAQEAIANLQLSAPWQGRLRLLRPLRVGEELAAGTLIAMLDPDERLVLSAEVGEMQIRFFEPGMPIELQVMSFASEVFRGSVHSVGHQAEIREGEAFFTVRFVLPADSRLRIGMSASAHLRLAESVDTLAVPSEYLRSEKLGDELCSFVDRMIGGTLTPIRVETGLEAGGYTEILSGLLEGDVVYREAQR